MSIGYKHGGTEGPLYHPERDFAYITPTLMRQAIENMSVPPNLEIEEWKTNNKITESEIIAAAEALADAQHDFVNSADPVTSLRQALHRRAYFSLRLPVRLLLESMIGEVMVSAWFTAVREITAVNAESPAQNEMCRFSAAVREFVAAKGAPVIDGAITADVVMAQNSVLRGQLSSAQDALKVAQRAAVTAENNATKLALELSRIPGFMRRVGCWFSSK